MAGNLEPLHLLRTKLFRPPAASDLVHRPRICDILTHNLDRPVMLVCAPAGFGKTTLLIDWLERCPNPSAWLWLDERDGELSVFLTFLIAAIRTLFPQACAETLQLLHAPVLPPVRVLATALANELERLREEPLLAAGQRFVLVLDDYHQVHEAEVHTLVTVKRHTVNIYQKLQVDNRRDAVNEGIALGLIAPSLPAYPRQHS